MIPTLFFLLGVVIGVGSRAQSRLFERITAPVMFILWLPALAGFLMLAFFLWVLDPLFYRPETPDRGVGAPPF